MSIPTFHFVENDTSDVAGRKAAQAQNTTRPAVVEVTYEAVGLGQHRVSRPVIFPVIFSTEPQFSSGCGLIDNVNFAVWHDPVGTCGVYQWQVDDRGYYLGAWMWVRVDAYTKSGQAATTGQVTASAKMRTQIYMTFSGRAIKDLPTNQITATLTPRRTGI